MRRASLPLIFSALLLSGCSAFTETNPPQPWTADRFKEAKDDDRRRLLGEDRTKSTSTDFLTYVPRKFWEGVEWTWNYSTGHVPYKYAKDLLDSNPDVRRNAIYTLSEEGFGRKAPYTDRYADMARLDADPTVRAAALRALNRSRDARHTGLYISSLTDESEWVRLEAVKALANIPDPKAVPQLMQILADDKQNRDIRIAAADALREFKQSDVAQTLIRTLGERDFGVAWQARRSLNLMTGKDFGYNAGDWLNYLTQTQKPFASATAQPVTAS